MSVDIALRVYASVTGPTAIFTTPEGVGEPLSAPAGEDIRQVIVQRAAAEARQAATAVELVTFGDHGEHRILIDSDGGIHRARSPEPVRFTEASEGKEVGTPAQEQEALGLAEAPAPEPLAPAPPTRRSFIEDADTSVLSLGGRALLAKIGLGPSRAQAERLAGERLVSQHWAGCRTAAVVNGKGGVGKTMTTAMLAAVFARHGGGNVLAWDNNDTRGTLGWRTEQGLYDTTVRDLLPAASQLLAPTAEISGIARFVHHQRVDRYDVL